MGCEVLRRALWRLFGKAPHGRRRYRMGPSIQCFLHVLVGSGPSAGDDRTSHASRDTTNEIGIVSRKRAVPLDDIEQNLPRTKSAYCSCQILSKEPSVSRSAVSVGMSILYVD